MRLKKGMYSQKILTYSHVKIVEAVEQNADGIVITDNNGVIEYANEAIVNYSGYSLNELIGRSASIFKSGRHDEQFYKCMWATIISGKAFQAYMINRKKNGELFYFDQTITPLISASGEITHYVSVWKERKEIAISDSSLDILMQTLNVERSKIQQVLSMEKSLNTIKNIDKVIDFVVYETASILEVKRCSLMFLDRNTEQLCIKGQYGLDEIAVGCSRVALGEPVAGLVAEMGEPIIVNNIEADDRFLLKNKEIYKNKSFMSCPVKLDDELLGVLNVSEKTSESDKNFNDLDFKIMSMIVCQVAATIGLSKLYRELNYFNTQDNVTHLFNYQHLTRALDYEIERMHSFSGMLSLIRIDVDNFKDYRKIYGERSGNELLKLVARGITDKLRSVDIACRYAQDEFVIILPQTGLEEAKLVALKIGQQINTIDSDQSIVVHMGVAAYRKGMERHDLLSKVNIALHCAKKEGKIISD